MNVALHIDMLIGVISERTVEGLADAGRDNALHCDTTGVLVDDIKVGFAGAQLAGQLDGDSIRFGNIRTSRIEAEVHREVIPHIVGAIRS